MTLAELKDIKERAEAASKGPWIEWQDGNQYVDPPTRWTNDNRRSRVVHAVIVKGLPRAWNPWWVGHEDPETSHKSHGESRFKSEDAAFIAAARSDVPTLIAEVERLRAALRDAIAAAESANKTDETCAALSRARDALGDAR